VAKSWGVRSASARRIVVAALALASACCTGTPALAQQAALSDTPEAFTQVLRDWTAKHKVGKAVVVVRRGGRTVHRAGIGGADTSGAYHLASLSKAITGACIATLVRDGKLALDAPLSQTLAKFFKRWGKPADARIERITIAQLLTHRGGFPSRQDGGDVATGKTLRSYLSRHSSAEPPKPDYLTTVLASRLQRDPGERYAYSNAGYLLLGAVIEEATERRYDEHCRSAVLTPAGAAGELDPMWRVMSSYGGWRMRGADYLAFFDQLDPAGARFGTAMRDWMLDRSGKTNGARSNPAWYGPGVFLREAGGGIDMWHTGSWRYRFPPGGNGPGLSQTSTFAMRIADGTSWFVHSTPVVMGEPRIELARELRRAHGSVRKWP
jgi:CubicO group peptidase (beta-lactamase class C family)